MRPLRHFARILLSLQVVRAFSKEVASLATDDKGGFVDTSGVSLPFLVLCSAEVNRGKGNRLHAWQRNGKRKQPLKEQRRNREMLKQKRKRKIDRERERERYDQPRVEIQSNTNATYS